MFPALSLLPAPLPACTPSLQVAVIAGNFELGELIRNHREQDVVPFQESPKYAARRRGPPGTGLTVPPALLRANSDTSMALPDWMVFSAPGASSSGAPGPTSGSQGQSQPSAPTTKLSSGTLRSASSPRGARARSPSRGRHPEDAKRQPRGRPSSSGTPREGPAGGTGGSGGPGGSLGSRGRRRKLYSAVPGRSFMAVKSYQAQAEGEISLSKGEKIKAASLTNLISCDSSLHPRGSRDLVLLSSPPMVQALHYPSAQTPQSSNARALQPTNAQALQSPNAPNPPKPQCPKFSKPPMSQVLQPSNALNPPIPNTPNPPFLQCPEPSNPPIPRALQSPNALSSSFPPIPQTLQSFSARALQCPNSLSTPII
ncbi:hypothetical protein P7K49_034911 [Saguinus oedipus]|uniref:Uncharacterized protein n=1 Tax=Saguinus oedipus TaxID=9490 RepID=A0ABQ9TWR2_SAGOE|nr:hypothetical protein P7K49_034911 [Saguinus oedipus]